jgi:hypothetical protein
MAIGDVQAQQARQAGHIPAYPTACYAPAKEAREAEDSMIRDPSDGSVRAPQKPAPAIQAPQHAERLPSSDAAGVRAGPILDTTTSGLPTGSSKPENIARLEKSREWLKQYFHRKTEGT